MLLLLVFASFLVIVGATASGQVALVTADSSAGLLNATVGADAVIVRDFASQNLRPGDVLASRTAERQAALQDGLHRLVDQGGILRVALLAPRGTVLATDDGRAVGTQAPMNEGLLAAVDHRSADAAIVRPDVAGSLTPLLTDSVLREYLPILQGGQVFAVVAIWRDATPILAELDAVRVHIVVITLTAAIVSALLLLFIFRAAQQRLTRQTFQLLEGARRDPMTGALNHGSLVELLAGQVEAARVQGGSIGVAVLDLDNFKLLNDTYGHPAGDHVLTEVVRLLGEAMPADATWGRYGPDEFLVFTATGGAATLEPALEDLRSTLAAVALQFDSSERLPVTFSAGLCDYPSHGESVTTLLSVAATTLDGAKASGGDAIRTAETLQAASSFVKTYGLLEGLVIAVDTKDRYTRQHSEDVARYGDFLARELGIEAATLQAVHTAGLLHDIGKIGIPDAILRKPGRLTESEYAIVKQHVALGDAIVRDLPDLALIRAGIRHHHERWDGAGYLDELAGEEIPLIARILAVGDAFSAMTTTRPYRKACSVGEALRRLEDAAGSQLEPHLVEVFVRGIEHSADAPLPGQPHPQIARDLIVPGRQVA